MVQLQTSPLEHNFVVLLDRVALGKICSKVFRTVVVVLQMIPVLEVPSRSVGLMREVEATLFL